LALGSARGLANRNLFPEVGPGVPWYQSATCIGYVLTDTLVKWFFDNFPYLPIVLVFFLFTALPED